MANVSGHVLRDGNPVGGVLVVARYMGWSGTGWGEFTTPQAKTDANGKFKLSMPRRRLTGIKVFARTADETLMATANIDATKTPQQRYAIRDPQRLNSFKLNLSPSIARKVRVLDAKEEPIEGAYVTAINDISWHVVTKKTNVDGVAIVRLPEEYQWSVLQVWKSGFGLQHIRDLIVSQKSTVPVTLEAAPPMTVKAVDALTDLPISGVLISVSQEQQPDRPRGPRIGGHGHGITCKTNEDGLAVVDWLPKSTAKEEVRIWGTRIEYAVASESARLGHQQSLTLRMRPYVRVHGRVVHDDGGPEVGIVVEAANVKSRIRHRTETDERGQFEFLVRPASKCILSVVDARWTTTTRLQAVQGESQTLDVGNLLLRPAGQLSGTVTHLGKPVIDQEISLQLYGPPSGTGKWPAKVVGREAPFASRSTWTDEHGRYEFYVGPGVYQLKGPSRIESADGILFERAPSYWSLNITKDSGDRTHDLKPTLWTESP